MAKKPHSITRSGQGLRDALFAEIEELRSGEGNPQRAQAVAKLAQQVISMTRLEIEFQTAVLAHAEKGVALALGEMPLANAVSVAPTATEAS